MNIENAFDKFLEKNVNLNPDRVRRIKEAQRVLSDFISKQEHFDAAYQQSLPQGSFRQKTIIKPVNDESKFDVDLLLELEKIEGWDPRDYLQKLAKVFRDTGRYKDITDTKGKNRCVTIDYEGDFNADIVPAILVDGQYHICNKETNEFEPTDGDGYASWFDTQNASSNGFLTPVVRLIKYLRDFKKEFETKSIVLTTIAGSMINPLLTSSGRYTTIPSTFAEVLSEMDKFLSQFKAPPSINNPAMPGENFDRHWKNNQSGFDRLKSAIAKYAMISDQAINTSDKNAAVKLWKELFGDDFVMSDSTANSEDRQGPSIIETAAPFTPQKPWSS